MRVRAIVVVATVALGAMWPLASVVQEGDVAVLLGLGQRKAAEPLIAREVPDLPRLQGTGHDGPQFYVVARHLLEPEAGAPHLDQPTYRYRRILYPAAAGALAPNGGRALVAAFLGVSLAGIALGAWALGTLPRARWWLPLTLAVTPGVLAALWLSLADALAAGLALGAFAAATRRRWAAMVALAVLAVLTRETMLVAAFGLVFAPRVATWARVAVFAAPLAVLAGWHAFLVVRLGSAGGDRAADQIAPPLTGWVRDYPDLATPALSIGLALLALMGMVAAARERPDVAAALGASLVVLVFLSEEVTGSWINTTRVAVLVLPLGTWALTASARVHQRHEPKRHRPEHGEVVGRPL